MRIILDLEAQAGGAVPAATLQVRPDEVGPGNAPGASSGGIVAMDAGAASVGDGTSAIAPIPALEQATVLSALNAGAAPEIIESTERPATTSDFVPPRASEGSAGSAPIVIDEFEIPPAVAKRIR